MILNIDRMVTGISSINSELGLLRKMRFNEVILNILAKLLTVPITYI